MKYGFQLNNVNTFGIIFSGLINSDDALKLLKVGKQFTQINVKTEKAASQLSWESSRLVTPNEIASSRKAVRDEEAEFRSAFETALTALENYEEIKEILS